MGKIPARQMESEESEKRMYCDLTVPFVSLALFLLKLNLNSEFFAGENNCDN